MIIFKLMKGFKDNRLCIKIVNNLLTYYKESIQHILLIRNVSYTSMKIFRGVKVHRLKKIDNIPNSLRLYNKKT